MKNVLVVAPHLDDEVIGCGGAIIRHADLGDRVTVVYLSRGGLCREDGVLTPSQEIRYRESAQAANVLGVAQQVLLNMPDRYIEMSQSSLEQLSEVVLQVQPDVVYCPHEWEAHPDHATVYKMTIRSLWLAARPLLDYPPVRGAEVLCYEVWTPMHRPGVVLDITQQIEQKMQAMRCYESQTKGRDYAAAIEGLARYRGVMTNTSARGYAEVFGTVSNAPTVQHSLEERDRLAEELGYGGTD